MKRTTKVGQNDSERPNGIVHNPVKEGAACEIPPLTKGHQLIDQIVDQTIKICNQPHGYGNKERQAYVRKSLEKYMTELEKGASACWGMGGNPNIGTHEATRRVYGRYRRDSFIVFEVLDGWCFTVDGSTEHIGPHPTRVAARKAGNKLMSELKRGAA